MRIPRILRNILIGSILLAGLLIFLAWLFLGSPFFRDLRVEFVERVLSKQIGMPVEVEGDVRLALVPTAMLSIRDLAVPGTTENDPDLVRVSRAELAVAPLELAFGDLNTFHLALHETRLEAIRYEDGRYSWNATDAPSAAPSAAPNSTPSRPPDMARLVNFLLKQSVDFREVSARVSDNQTGLDLDFHLDNLQLEREETEDRSILEGAGSLNGSDFTLSGSIPLAGSVRVDAGFAGVDLRIDGVVSPSDGQKGFSGTLEIAIDSLANFLGVLGLAAPYDGTASFKTSLDRSGMDVSASDIVAEAALEDGTAVTLEGNIGNLRDRSGVSLELTARGAPRADTDGTAAVFDISGLSAAISSVDGGYRLDSLNVETAAVDGTLKNLGPISVERVRITDKELLELSGVRIQIGTEETGLAIGEGRIGDALSFSDLAFAGRVTLPVEAVLPGLETQPPGGLGRLEGAFDLDRTDGPLRLSRFALNAVGTDIWSLDLSGQIADLRRLGNPKLSATARIPDIARLLTRLSLDSVASGSLDIATGYVETMGALSTSLSLRTGDSEIVANLRATGQGETPRVRGSVDSQQLDLKDMASLVSLVRDIAKRARSATGGVGEQPLVMPNAVSIEPPKVIDDPNVAWQPLVMGDTSDDGSVTDAGPIKPADPLEEQPLVIGKAAPNVSFLDLILKPEGLARLDLEVPITVRKLTGQQGVSRLQSKLAVQDGQASFGPLSLALGGGSFSLNAGMDLVRTPDLVRITGSTQGWDIASIMAAIGSDFPVQGKPTATFDLRARYASPSAFLDSMAGSISVRMGPGAIGTSFLDLAGLGVIPWLFSKELSQGYTNVECLSAPLSIANGRVTTSSTVLETRRVQIVLGGTVDWKRNAISLRGDPRPVGQPLARSPWPFEITGALSNPQFSLPKSVVRRAQVPLEFGGTRLPCRPDVTQLRPVSDTRN